MAPSAVNLRVQSLSKCPHLHGTILHNHFTTHNVFVGEWIFRGSGSGSVQAKKFKLSHEQFPQKQLWCMRRQTATRPHHRWNIFLFFVW